MSSLHVAPEKHAVDGRSRFSATSIPPDLKLVAGDALGQPDGPATPALEEPTMLSHYEALRTSVRL
jgi:hypothetical protein